MPSHELHEFCDIRFFGKHYRRLHKAIDFAVRFYGKAHRRFFHKPWEVVVIARFLYPKDGDACLSGLLHLVIDRLCSNDPVFEGWLRFLVKEDKEAKRRDQQFRELLCLFMEQMHRNNLLLAEALAKSAKQRMEEQTKLFRIVLWGSKKIKRKKHRKT